MDKYAGGCVSAAATRMDVADGAGGVLTPHFLNLGSTPALFTMLSFFLCLLFAYFFVY